MARSACEPRRWDRGLGARGHARCWAGWEHSPNGGEPDVSFVGVTCTMRFAMFNPLMSLKFCFRMTHHSPRSRVRDTISTACVGRSLLAYSGPETREKLRMSFMTYVLSTGRDSYGLMEHSETPRPCRGMAG